MGVGSGGVVGVAVDEGVCVATEVAVGLGMAVGAGVTMDVAVGTTVAVALTVGAIGVEVGKADCEGLCMQPRASASKSAAIATTPDPFEYLNNSRRCYPHPPTTPSRAPATPTPRSSP